MSGWRGRMSTVISEAAAKLCFPGEDPIGRHLKIDMKGESTRYRGGGGYAVADFRAGESDYVYPALRQRLQ